MGKSFNKTYYYFNSIAILVVYYINNIKYIISFVHKLRSSLWQNGFAKSVEYEINFIHRYVRHCLLMWILFILSIYFNLGFFVGMTKQQVNWLGDRCTKISNPVDISFLSLRILYIYFLISFDMCMLLLWLRLTSVVWRFSLLGIWCIP